MCKKVWASLSLNVINFALYKYSKTFIFGVHLILAIIAVKENNAKIEVRRYLMFNIQSTLVISKSKGPSEKLRDIRTSTYQICRIEENANQTTKFHK